jgi:hypothetical protein
VPWVIESDHPSYAKLVSHRCCFSTLLENRTVRSGMTNYLSAGIIRPQSRSPDRTGQPASQPASQPSKLSNTVHTTNTRGLTWSLSCIGKGEPAQSKALFAGGAIPLIIAASPTDGEGSTTGLTPTGVAGGAFCLSFPHNPRWQRVLYFPGCVCNLQPQ